MRVRKQYGEIFLLPSAFTLTNLFFGFLSIWETFHGHYRTAALWIMVAAIIDGFDGILARSTHTHSEFGLQLDSLADAVSFGCGAALLLYYWGLRPARSSGIFFSFIFLAAGVLRLARYNIRSKSQPDRRYYTGYTVPSSAMFFVSIVFLHPQPLYRGYQAAILSLLILFVSFCMVSTIPYRNFLNFNLRHRIDIKTAFLMAVILVTLIFYTRYFIFGFFVFNLVHGPVAALVRRLRKTSRQEKKPEEQKETLS
jgi:CDP-diacylglycerol--serine O-phosphatidyltransferase